jgi:DNA modification methylase
MGDARKVLKLIGNQSVNCCITSPPYWLKRDYYGGANELSVRRRQEVIGSK